MRCKGLEIEVWKVYGRVEIRNNCGVTIIIEDHEVSVCVCVCVCVREL